MKAATELELFRLLADMDLLQTCPPFSEASEVYDASVQLVAAPVAAGMGHQESKDGDTSAGQWLADVQEFDAYRTDPYQLFGIPYDATDATIKSTFRKLSLRVHPDRCPGAFHENEGGGKAIARLNWTPLFQEIRLLQAGRCFGKHMGVFSSRAILPYYPPQISRY